MTYVVTKVVFEDIEMAEMLALHQWDSETEMCTCKDGDVYNKVSAAMHQTFELISFLQARRLADPEEPSAPAIQHGRALGT